MEIVFEFDVRNPATAKTRGIVRLFHQSQVHVRCDRQIYDQNLTILVRLES